jgi:hypothetical protein
MKHILFGFLTFFTLQREFVWREKVQAKEETFLLLVCVCLCVCVASVVCVPRARPRDSEPVTPSPLSPPCASRALCALRAGTKCEGRFIYIHVYMLVCASVMCQQVLCALSYPTPWPTHPPCASQTGIMCVCMYLCVWIGECVCVCVLGQRVFCAYRVPDPVPDPLLPAPLCVLV